MRRIICIVWAALLSFGGCNFAGRPSLPKRAATEVLPAPRDEERFTEIVQQADVIYLATDRLGLALGSEPAWQLVRALQKSGADFAIGWGVIENRGQDLFENDDRMEIAGKARERENCRVVFSEAERSGITQIALGSAFENRTSQSEQFAAERIVNYLREHKGGKLLVLLARRQLEAQPGIPVFVAQKIDARQIVLDSRKHLPERPDLLTEVGIDRAFQVVD